MSIKIYDGLKLDTTDVYEIQKFLSEFQKLALNEFNNQVFKRVGGQIALRHDSYVVGLIDEEPKIDVNDVFNILTDMAEKCRETQIKFERDLEDYFCSLKLYILKDKTLLLCRAEQKFYNEILESMDEVSEYGYWNNTDKPDEIDKDVWMQRENEWMNAYSIPAWTFDVFGIRDFPYEIDNIKNIKKYYPSLENRVARVAEAIALKEKFKDCGDDITGRHISKYAFSREFKDDIKRISNEIKDRFTDIELYQKLTSK